MSYRSSKAKKLAQKYEIETEIMIDLVELLNQNKAEEMLNQERDDIKNTARVNLLLTSRKELIQKLKNEGIIAKPLEGISEGIVILEGATKIGSSTSYLTGEVMPQGLGSMLTIQALDPQPEEYILDLAAAPGGKSCFIGERMRGKGELVANDISKSRIRSLIYNLGRHQIRNVTVTNQDGKKITTSSKFDRILLDAPCSGSGLVISKPDRRIRQLSDLIHLQKIQQKLLYRALKLLKEDGILVYSTCSFSILENEEVIKPILGKVKSIDPKIPGKRGYIELNDDFKHARRIYPHTQKCDGFFIMKMVK